jgi:heptosyltransferase-2
MKVNKLLLIRTHAMGDVLLTTPVIRALRKHFSFSEIVMLVGEWSMGIVKNNPYLDRIITFNDKKFFNQDLSSIFALLKRLRGENFDTIIAFHRSLKVHFFISLLGAKYRIALANNGKHLFLTHPAVCKKDTPPYVVLDYLKILSPLNIKSDGITLDFFLGKQDINFAKEILKNVKKPLICIAPGGGSNPVEKVERRWDIQKYIQLGKELKKEGTIIIIGGKEDIGICEKLYNHVGGLNLCNKTTLTQTAGIIKLSNILISNDSLSLHLGVAMNTPSVGIFGPSLGETRLPKDKKYIIIQSKAKCSPCCVNERFKGCKNIVCFQQIEVQEVREKAIKLLSLFS